MKLKFLLPGIVLFALGALLVLTPGIFTQLGTEAGIGVSPTHTATYFVHVGQENYSYVQFPLGAGESLTASIASGQQTVDFFLMNEANFTAWAGSGGEPGQVYPQSSLDVKNYTFNIPSSASPRTYVILFVSRSTTSSTDVLIRMSLRATPSDQNSTTLSVALVVVGVAMASYGARSGRRHKPAEPPNSTVSASPSLGGWGSLLGVGPAKCKYCGTALVEGSSFCPSCRKSQA